MASLREEGRSRREREWRARSRIGRERWRDRREGIWDWKSSIRVSQSCGERLGRGWGLVEGWRSIGGGG